MTKFRKCLIGFGWPRHLLAGFILLALPLGFILPSPALAASWSFTGSLSAARTWHTATRLVDGKVLVVGGRYGNWSFATSTDLYDPASKTWTQTIGTPLHTPRANHTATLLADGKVLVAGGGGIGTTLGSAELYDPASQSWSETGPLNTPRGSHTATLLANGQVLVAGGMGADAIHLTSAELYDPVGQSWSYAAPLNGHGGPGHTATLLANGQVLVAGGWYGEYLNSSELYNPGADSWTPTTYSLHTGFFNHTATRLASGQVLVAGGGNYTGSPMANAEFYDPAGQTWSETGFLNTARYKHTMTLLANGKVLVAGGAPGTGNFNSLSSAELYDPASQTWNETRPLNNARNSHTATLLANGQVLAVGGFGTSGMLSSAEIYNAWALPIGALDLLLLD